jgi:hypothetical protein
MSADTTNAGLRTPSVVPDGLIRAHIAAQENPEIFLEKHKGEARLVRAVIDGPDKYGLMIDHMKDGRLPEQ